MLFIAALILAVLFASSCRTPLKKHAFIFYIAAAIVSAAVTIFDFRGAPAFVQNYIIGLFSRGAFAAALWCVVMWIGALPNGSKPMKALMPVRGELSIFAAILTIGHNLGYGKTYFVRMFSAPASMKPTQLTAGILSIIMLAIMIPLTILSFPYVRKKMSAKIWKRIQRTAYLFYALLYVHVMLLFLPNARNGRMSYQLSVIIYSLVFIGYAACRIQKAFGKKSPEIRKLVSRVSGVGIVFSMIVVIVLMVPQTSAEKINGEIPDAPNTGISNSHENDNTQDDITQKNETDVDDRTFSLYKDGTYSASVFGYDGDVTVSVTVLGDIITDITAQTEEEDPWYFEQAEKTVISAIISGQTTDVDAVSGATYSSNAIIHAVQSALEKAKNGN